MDWDEIDFDQRKLVAEEQYPALRELLDSKWTFLGQGCASRVYASPEYPGIARKLGRRKDGWLDYAEFCRHTTSKHALRVHSLTVYPDCYVADMERLQVLPFEVWDGIKGAFWYPYGNSRAPVSLVRFVRRLRAMKHHCDFGPTNTMIRWKTGDVVISDPWFTRLGDD